ncbi:MULTISPECIES: hypothetical protein [Nocardia]|uniref:hypothetical protein n=1 Tax=Nocardia TaxID=1817 RepID=UPI000D696F06|nr:MULTISPECIES: hypothetical protein [Nocardia]
MMRAAFGALAVAGALVTAPSAYAAQGSVVMDGSVLRDPVGCLEATAGRPQLTVENHTDATVTVYSRPGCRGEVTAVLTPSQIATTNGASLQIS